MKAIGYCVQMFRYSDYYGHHISMPTRLVNEQSTSCRWHLILVPSEYTRDHITVFKTRKEARNAMARTRNHQKTGDFHHLSIRVVATPPRPMSNV